ncbi:hypothetical protein C8Q73DRAFT_521776 [Cubamyces lactineus]|nr:hypothetical protein C8Q73DRAFT_521776 [Cubamyces lactineus]
MTGVFALRKPTVRPGVLRSESYILNKPMHTSIAGIPHLLIYRHTYGDRGAADRLSSQVKRPDAHLKRKMSEPIEGVEGTPLVVAELRRNVVNSKRRVGIDVPLLNGESRDGGCLLDTAYALGTVSFQEGRSRVERVQWKPVSGKQPCSPTARRCHTKRRRRRPDLRSRSRPCKRQSDHGPIA